MPPGNLERRVAYRRGPGRRNYEVNGADVKRVLIILTCYSRPQNMPRVIQAWNNQTHKSDVVVVDNRKYSPQTQSINGEILSDLGETYPIYELSGDGYDAPKDVFRWMENSGCPCWLAPAVMLGHRYDYILRADDDLLPHSKAVESCVAWARYLDDEFTTIGQVARNFPEREGMYLYDRRNVAPSQNKLVKVDLTCRVSFTRPEVVYRVATFRQRLVELGGADLVEVHDDFMLCCAGQTWPDLFVYTAGPSYVLPHQESYLVETNLPNGGESVWKRPDHYQERQRMLDLCVKAGWRTLRGPA